MSTTVTTAAVCLVCDSELAIEGGSEKGEIVECGTCGQEHELTAASDAGYEVSLAPEVEEDWGE
ncbi:lysine biosynthesis protein LysW [Streptomyces bohaiensis]|uniref:Lysine biosynthesis protein LysW n=1 Tax=Streptomyces bohaiensis TaxID=1431344 RepID=A0ABX1C5R6_9ACTN|nr:lysine biosynthesis protein LysW [Streptomyces bohaiensis]NJQ14273.1 lysine biosynthesis protein LysW [Streptomyces bohaiensis]